MTLVDGKGWRLGVSEGWVQLSAGALQYQKRTIDGRLGITHSATPPALGVLDDFVEADLGIKMSLGSNPCYACAIDEDVYIAFLDIS